MIIRSYRSTALRMARKVENLHLKVEQSLDQPLIRDIPLFFILEALQPRDYHGSHS
jgi:hypothetical protein